MKARTNKLIAWSVWTLVLALVGGGLLLALLNRSTVEPHIWELYTLFMLSAFSFAGVGGLIARRHPGNPIGWLFCVMAFAFAALPFATEYAIRGLYLSPGSLPAAQWVGYSTDWLFVLAAGPIGLVFLLFPNGRALSRRWGALAWVLGVSLALTILGEQVVPVEASGVGGNRFETHGGKVPNPFGMAWTNGRVSHAVGGVLAFVTLLCSVAAVVALILRLRRAQAMERQQVRWLAYMGAAALLLPLLIILFVPVALASHSDAFGNVLGDLFWTGITLILALGIPLASGIAILKYRLYDLDVVVKKTVVFGVLAAFVTLVYVGVVTGIGALVGSRGNSALTFAAAAIVAVAFQPLRARAHKLADRVVYGKRATPYEVLSVFSDRMAGTYSTEDVLPRLARILGEGTGATRTEVWLRVGGEFQAAASWPESGNGQPERLPITGDELPDFPAASQSFAVRHQGELLGALALTKPPSEPLTPTETKLLSDLASQVGLVLRNVRLTSELQARLEELRASRQRLVAAQDQERRRLERNLHDGAQQQLVALGVQLNLAQRLASQEAPQVAALLDRLRTQTTDALDNLRDLARGIYPPLLADQGLPAALSAQARKSAVPVEVEADGVGRYPQDVEAAVYFCTLEALNNVAKYANATRARIHLSQSNGELTFEIADDGQGFDPGATGYGTGLQGMADRLDAIGGVVEVESAPGRGTTVMGRVPAAPIL